MPTKEKSQILESCLPLNYIAEEDSKLILPWVNSISNYLQDKRQVFEWVKRHGNTKCRMDSWLFFVRVNFEKLLLKLCVGYKNSLPFHKSFGPILQVLFAEREGNFSSSFEQQSKSNTIVQSHPSHSSPFCCFFYRLCGHVSKMLFGLLMYGSWAHRRRIVEP